MNDLDILQMFYEDCRKYWLRQDICRFDPLNASKRALRDICLLYKENGGCIHDPYVPNGKELDHEIVIQFIKEKSEVLGI